MPELPEIEAVCKSLAPCIEFKTISSAHVNNLNCLQNIDSSTLESSLSGKTIVQLSRRGKYLIFLLQDGSRLIMHFALTGELCVCNTDNVTSSMLTIKLCDGAIIHLIDYRTFANVWFIKPIAFGITGVLDKLGPEPLSDGFTLEYLIKKCKLSTDTIKGLLMNQYAIAGIGNCYADEILYSSAILPDRKADSLNDNEYMLLFNNIKTVLSEFIEFCLSSSMHEFRFSSFEEAVRHKCLVHAHKICPVCKSPLHTKKISGRNSYFCQNCQR